MIKIDELYQSNPNDAVKDFFESPSRAVTYAFDENEPLDLNENVWFQIEEYNEVQAAYNIIRIDSLTVEDSLKLMSTREKFALLKKIHLNLHNGDKHRDGPKHKRVHVLDYFQVRENNSITKIIVRDEETDDEFIRYIRTSDLPDDDELGNIFYIQYEMTIDTFQVYTLDLNHLH